MFDAHSEELEDYGVASSEMFKFKNGKNKIRILAGGVPIAKHWLNKKPTVCYGLTKGCPYHKATDDRPRIQYAFYLLDKTQEHPVIQLAELPYTIHKAMVAYSKEDGYEFDSLPMPYDLSVTYDPDESPADMYKVIASPKSEPVPQEVLDALAKKETIESIVGGKKLKAMKMEGDGEVVGESNTEDTDF